MNDPTCGDCLGGHLTRRGFGTIPFMVGASEPMAADVATGSSVRTVRETGAVPHGNEGRKTTDTDGSERFTFAIEADPHLDEQSDPRIFGDVIDAIVGASPAFLIDLGDTLMVDKIARPTADDIRGRATLFRTYFDRLGSVPLHMVIGNHDGEAGWAPALARMSNDVRREAFPASVGAVNHYSFTHGGALFILLDPFGSTMRKPTVNPWAWTLGRAQYDWLVQTLAMATETWRFVFIHHLVGGDRLGRGGIEVARAFEWGGNDPDGSPAFGRERPGWQLPIHDVLVAHGVTAVFKGHDHLYVRQELDGITYQTVPQPSHPGEAIRQAAEYGYMTGDVRGGSGYLSVEVAQATATVTFMKWHPRTGLAVDTAYTLLPRVVTATHGRSVPQAAPS
jgi:hypothetical protein